MTEPVKPHTVEFPPIAQERINAFQIQINSLQAQLQQFADGLIVGMGVDVKTCDISIDLGAMVAHVTPKTTGETPIDGGGDEPPP